MQVAGRGMHGYGYGFLHCIPVTDQPVLPRPYRGGMYRGGWHSGHEQEGDTEGARVSLGGSGVLEGAGPF